MVCIVTDPLHCMAVYLRLVNHNYPIAFPLTPGLFYKNSIKVNVKRKTSPRLDFFLLSSPYN